MAAGPELQLGGHAVRGPAPADARLKRGLGPRKTYTKQEGAVRTEGGWGGTGGTGAGVKKPGSGTGRDVFRTAVLLDMRPMLVNRHPTFRRHHRGPRLLWAEKGAR